MKNVVIIGAGWYGLHIFLHIRKKYKHLNLIILERNSDIFEGSSTYNQNRLHLGYHYPRSHKTRELCKSGYLKFMKEYHQVVEVIDENYYCISKDSNIDYETFLKIFKDDEMYDHNIVSNDFLNKMDGDLINTSEKIINSKKSKKYFKDEIDDKFIKYNYNVVDIKRKGSEIIINDDISCDLLIDCTYNNLQIQPDCIFELTISLLYRKIGDNVKFDSLTVMDGEFFSLFPRDISENKYSLTHVKYTPIIKSRNVQEVVEYKVSDEQVLEIKNNMEKCVVEYYSNFLKDFEFFDYFLSYKCKTKSNNDLRDCNIYQKDGIISVNCGKIIGIFEFENYIDEYMENKL